MSVHSIKIKTLTFDIGGDNFEAQLISCTMNNNTPDGDTTYTYGGNDDDPTEPGAVVEDADPDYSFDLVFFADWRSGGISDYLWVHDGETLTFQADRHPNSATEHVRWTGSLKIKAPNVSGDPNTTERTEITLKVVGAPTYAHL